MKEGGAAEKSGPKNIKSKSLTKKKRQKALLKHFRTLKKNELKKRKIVDNYVKKEFNLRKVVNLDVSPIIGILTLPMTFGKHKHTHSYLAQSYIKWIEMSGGRVVPIQYDLPQAIVHSMLSQCNGLLLTGGQVDNKMISKEYISFMITIKNSFNYIRGENLRGNYYPIFGICLGFEILSMLHKNPNISNIIDRYENHKGISYMKAHNYSAKNIFIKGNFRISKIFSKKEKNYQANNPCVIENHGLGFFPNAPYMDNYRKQWDIVSLAPENKPKNKARNYINMIEFKNFPFYGCQFHPEKAVFEWLTPGMIHTQAARTISHKLGEFFIDEARKNKNKLFNKDWLIYNYTLYARHKAIEILHPKKYIFKKNKSVFESAYYFNVAQRDI